MKKKKKDVILNIRLDEELKQKLFLYCFNNNISISRFVRLILIDFLDEYYQNGGIYENN